MAGLTGHQGEEIWEHVSRGHSFLSLDSGVRLGEDKA